MMQKCAKFAGADTLMRTRYSVLSDLNFHLREPVKKETIQKGCGQ